MARWEELELHALTVIPQCPPAPDGGAVLRLTVTTNEKGFTPTGKGFSSGEHETFYGNGGFRGGTARIIFTADDEGKLTLETYCDTRRLKQLITLLHRYAQEGQRYTREDERRVTATEGRLPRPELTIMPPAASHPPTGGYYYVLRTTQAYGSGPGGWTLDLHFETDLEDFYIPMARDVATDLGQRLTAALGIKPSRQKKVKIKTLHNIAGVLVDAEELDPDLAAICERLADWLRQQPDGVSLQIMFMAFRDQGLTAAEFDEAVEELLGFGVIRQEGGHLIYQGT